MAIGFATSSSANYSWRNYHWARTSNPFTLKLGDNVSPAWDAYLDEAIVDWSVSSVLDLTEVIGGTRPRNCRATAGRIEACSERYGNTGWLGIAQIWITGGEHITQVPYKSQRHVLQHGHLQHASVAAVGHVPGNRARLRPGQPSDHACVLG